MATALENEDCPLDANIEKVFPGVNERFHNARQDLRELHRNITDQLSDIVTTLLKREFQAAAQEGHKHVLQESSAILGALLVDAGNSLLGSNASFESLAIEEQSPSFTRTVTGTTNEPVG